jgi:hypothetical protein
VKAFKVRVKNSNRAETIKANSELEAKIIYCRKRGFNYRVFANNIEATEKTRQDKTGH